MTYRIDLSDCVALINDDEIREFVEHALKHVDKNFWIVPASSSGKYHCEESNIRPGGLVVHIRRSIVYALHLIEFYKGRRAVNRDIVLAGVLLHDFTKGGIPWSDRTDPSHGPVAAKRLGELYEEKFKKNNRKIDRICHLVKIHMARWNPEPTPPGDGEYDEHIVCVADYLGSMRNLSLSARSVNEIVEM